MRVGEISFETPFEQMTTPLSRHDFETCARRTVRVDDTTASQMNALRRALLTGVPTIAVAHLDIRINTSSMPDEVLALQLGLTPLRTDPCESWTPAEKEACAEIVREAQTDDGARFVLRVEGRVQASAASAKPAPTYTPVRAGDIRHARTGMCISVFPHAVIHHILDGHQQIDIDLSVKMNTIESHHKHVAFSECSFVGIPRVQVLSQPSADIVSACPAAVFERKDGAVQVANENMCVMCGECVKMEPAAVSISESTTSFLLLLRPTGRRSVRHALDMALERVAPR